MGSEGWSRERWKDGKYWSVYRDVKGRIRARESARDPKGRFRKFPEPPEKPLWRVHGGWTSSNLPEDYKLQGNVRAVKYVESWSKPEEPDEKWARKMIENTSGQFSEGTRQSNYIDKLLEHGEWSYEVEKVDRSELPGGYEKGNWYVELFKSRSKRPEGVKGDYGNWRVL